LGSVNFGKSSVNLGKSSVNPGKSSVNPGKSSVNPGKSSVNPGKSSVNPGKSSVNLNDNYLSDISDESPEIDKSNNNELICKYCNKVFLRKDYLESHLKKSCKMLKEFNNIYEFDKDTFGKNIYKNFKNAGDIYILQTDYINNDHYKIGITNNIQKRLGSYRCGNTYEPRLHYYISCQDVSKIDNVIKTQLVKYNIKREIFKGDIENFKQIIVEVVRKEFNLDKVHVHEPNIKLGDLSECTHCNK
jgi:phage FluMu protein Com